MKLRLLGAVFILVLVLGFSRAESGGQEYIVTLKGGESVSALNHAHGTRTVVQVPNTSIYLIKTDDNDSDDKILNHLRHDKSVESAEKNAQVKLRSDQQATLNSALADAMASLLDRRFLFSLNDAMASLLDGQNASGVFPSAWGHGTLVAGVIHVVAPNARIIPIKAFDAYGHTSMFTIIEGVYQARDLNVDVLNMSFSTSEPSFTL